MAKRPAPGSVVLTTERLILRRFRMEDAAAYREMMCQPSVEAMLVKGPASDEEAGRALAMFEGYWALRGFALMAVIERSTGLLVGRVGPWMPHGWPDLEVGWTIHPRRQKQGYAAEAAKAAARWVFEQFPDQSRVIHVIEPRNAGSAAVAAAIGGSKTGEVFRHPLVGPLDVWATPREAVL